VTSSTTGLWAITPMEWPTISPAASQNLPWRSILATKAQVPSATRSALRSAILSARRRRRLPSGLLLLAPQAVPWPSLPDGQRAVRHFFLFIDPQSLLGPPRRDSPRHIHRPPLGLGPSLPECQ
jgi:hypothetical protein